MELWHYLDILKRRVLVIIIVTTLTVSVVAAASLFITPIYTASAKIRVLQDVGVVDLGIRESYGERLMNTYSHILTSWPVLEQANERLGTQFSIEQLREKTAVEVIPDTELIRVTAEDQDPTFAALFANTLATLLIEHAQGIYTGNPRSTLQIVAEQLADIERELKEDRQQLSNLQVSGGSGAEIEALSGQIQSKADAYDRLLDRYELARLNESLRANSITVVEPATAPGTPSNALGLMEIGIGIVVGLSGGVGLALVVENLDTRIHSPRQLEHLTHLPVLGTVPTGLLSLGSLGHPNGTDSSKPIEEAYRLLGVNLQALREDTPLKTILITSAMPKEGKSATAANLAQTLAERGQTVFLVESDMRRPTVARMLDIENRSAGLGGLLSGRSSLSHESLGRVIHPAKQPSLFVIGGGPRIANPTPLLASPLMEELLGYLGAHGQTTLLDAPPVLGMADVSVLAPRADGIILVVRQAQTKREQVFAALKQLQASRARVIGIVLLTTSDKGWKYG